MKLIRKPDRELSAIND